jgi:hypothetical protein
VPTLSRTQCLAALLTFALTWTLSAPALADAKVVVELKDKAGAPADGTVELKKGGETKHSCTTQAARCELSGVPGGMYTVEVKQPGKPSPKPKEVMIPPSGEVKLIVNAS